MTRLKMSLAAAAVTALALAGCGEPTASADSTSGSTTEQAPKQGTILTSDYASLQVWQVLVNGQYVTCVVFRDSYKGGLSCDFAGASKEGAK